MYVFFVRSVDFPMMTFVQLTTIQGEPFRWAAPAPSNLYPVGTSPYQDPSCNSARAQGSKGDGTLLPSGMLQPDVVPVTHPTLESVRLFRSSPFGGSNHAFRMAPLGTKPVSR